MTINTPILLDISRLIWRAWRPAPTGIDRVELSYVTHFLSCHPRQTIFVAMNLFGVVGAMQSSTAHLFIETLSTLWEGQDKKADRRLLRRVRLLSLRLRQEILIGGEARLAAELLNRIGRPVYLLVSHHHLDRPTTIKRVKTRFNARFVCLVHDLIPVDFPEYARPQHDLRHRRRMDTVVGLGDGVIVNSSDTRESFVRYLRTHQTESARDLPIRVAMLGTPQFLLEPQAGMPRPADDPYFVFISTIEPRKNHLLLLNIWRSLATEAGTGRAPRLILIGGRGWENENVVDMLERCPALQGVVEETKRLSDNQLGAILTGARALLLPSFAEGYGLPLAEALAMGVPSIVSILPSLREIGGDVPEYLDPLDGVSWRQAILDYAMPESPRRAAQLARLPAWTPPTWATHFNIVEDLLNEISR